MHRNWILDSCKRAYTTVRINESYHLARLLEGRLGKRHGYLERPGGGLEGGAKLDLRIALDAGEIDFGVVREAALPVVIGGAA